MTRRVETLAGGALQGGWRTPVNIAADAKGSIHNDETAQALGLDGGWIAGSIHLEQFVPLFVGCFGSEWLRSGGVSAYFSNATVSGQKVRATLAKPCAGEGHADFTMEDAQGRVVCSGEAWLGAPPQKTSLRARLGRFDGSAAGPLLAGLSPGKQVTNVGSIISSQRLAQDLPGVTEPMDAYLDGVLPPNLAIDALRAVEAELFRLPDGCVGLYGGIELQMIDGPICADADYLCAGKILAVGQTPRTEVLFYQSELFQNQKPVARLLMMSRIMKP